MIAAVRQPLPACTIVLGGPHATVSGAEILGQYPEVDFVLGGEGELSFFSAISRSCASSSIGATSAFIPPPSRARHTREPRGDYV